MTSLSIPSPCHESWDAMTRTEAGRHCASCAKTVVDVTAMAPAAAQDYLRRELPMRIDRGERVCVHAHIDRSGRLLRPGVTRRLLTNGLAAVLAMAMADYVGATPGLQGAEGDGQQPGVEQPMRGEVMVARPGGVMPLPAPPVGPAKGDVAIAPACLAVPAVPPVTDEASGITVRVDPAGFLMIGDHGAAGEAWRVDLARCGVPADSGHLPSDLTLSDHVATVTCGDHRVAVDVRTGTVSGQR